MVSLPFRKCRYSTFFISSKTRFMCGPLSWVWSPNSVHVCSMVEIFGEDISIDAPQALDALHQHPAEPVILEPRAPNSAVFSLNS